MKRLLSMLLCCSAISTSYAANSTVDLATFQQQLIQETINAKYWNEFRFCQFVSKTPPADKPSIISINYCVVKQYTYVEYIFVNNNEPNATLKVYDGTNIIDIYHTN